MSNIKLFESKKIRSHWAEKEEKWYFSVVDVIEVLTESPTPRQYWGKIKDREFVKNELSPIWVQLKMVASDGKMRVTDCADAEGLFRIIQSVPSPKAEPFKLWLAKVAGNARKETEKELKRSIVSEDNFLGLDNKLQIDDKED